jgi:MFS superfamily sulfate permease-like transporter
MAGDRISRFSGAFLACAATTTWSAIRTVNRSGLVLFRWDAPLFFANAKLFQERLSQAIAESPTRVRRVVVAAQPVTSVE